MQSDEKTGTNKQRTTNIVLAIGGPLYATLGQHSDKQKNESN